MRIAYVTATEIPSKAANSVHVMKMAQALSQDGHDVHLMCMRTGDTILPSDPHDICQDYDVAGGFQFHFESISLGSKSKLSRIVHSFKRAMLAKKLKCDLVFSRCMLTAFFATLFGRSSIFEIHDSPYSLSKLSVFIFKLLIKKKKLLFLVVISQALKAHIAQEFKVPLDHIYVAADGADPMTAQLTPAPFVKSTDGLDVGYVGHLYRGRGINIIAAVAKKIPDIKFHIVGGTPEDVSYWRVELKDFSNIHFYGFVPHKEATKYIQNFDVLLAPYQKKVAVSGGGGNTVQWMSPLKIFEYMSAGKAIISSDLPVLHEVLQDRENALLCPAEDVESWVAALNFLKNNPDESVRMGEKAKDIFLEKYTWSKRAQNIMKQAKSMI